MAVEEHDVEWLQEQIYQLQDTLREQESRIGNLEMENTLLRNDLNTIKMEGCYRFVEDKNHKHEDIDEN